MHTGSARHGSYDGLRPRGGAARAGLRPAVQDGTEDQGGCLVDGPQFLGFSRRPMSQRGALREEPHGYLLPFHASSGAVSASGLQFLA